MANTWYLGKSKQNLRKLRRLYMAAIMYINTDKVTGLGSWFFPLKATLKHRNVIKYNIQLLFNTCSLSFCENNTTSLKIQHYRATHPTWIC